MESEAKSLQNDFFNEARKARALVSVFLGNGKKLTGRIKSFDKYTLLLENHFGELIVFKHAISTVGPARAYGEGEGERRPAHAEAAAGEQPRPGTGRRED